MRLRSEEQNGERGIVWSRNGEDVRTGCYTILKRLVFQTCDNTNLIL